MRIIRSGFTLIELMLVTIMSGILIVVLFQTYRQINNIALKVQQEKILNTELLFVMQTIQNKIDEGYTIDLNQYDPDTIDQINKNNGFINTGLILSQSGNYITIYQDCDSINNNKCGLMMNIFSDNNSTLITLTNNKLITIPSLGFKVANYINGNNKFSVDNKIHPGFWLYLSMESKGYSQKNPWQGSDIDIQTFFTTRNFNGN